jgi:multidrug efflux pump
VEDAAENLKQAAWMNTAPAVILNIQRQPGANIIQVVDRIKALLPQLKASLPASVDVSILTDRTTTIRASVRDVQFELMLTIALVVMVIFLFLRTLAATVIPSVAVPLSLVGTFGAMYMLGYSLNNLTLMALTISTGFVVDDAIVMIENIVRYIEEGMPAKEAALKGSEQIGFTILSLTVSLIAVLIPLLFMGDIVGRLFREFAMTLSVTILISAVISLTLTPMMCSRLLKHQTPKSRAASRRSPRRSSNRSSPPTEVAALGPQAPASDSPRRRRDAGRHHRTLVRHSQGLFPGAGHGVLLGISEAPQSVSFPAMAERQQALAREILKDPAVESLSSFIGVDGTNTTLNSGRLQINLKPHSDRDSSATEISRRIQKAVAGVSGITLYLQPVQDLTVEDRVSRTQFQYSLESPDTAELATWVPRFIERLRALPELADVASDQQNQGLRAAVTVDRATASRLGITPQMVDDALYDAFGQRQVSTIFTQTNQYRVVLEWDPDFQTSPADLDHVYLRSAVGGMVPLSTLAKIETVNAPLVINHQGQFPVVTVSFNLAPGSSLGAATRAIERARQSLGMPASIQASFQGTARAFRASLAKPAAPDPGGDRDRLHPARRSLRELHHPITILSTLPSAAVGALLALMITGIEFSVVSLIGIIL